MIKGKAARAKRNLAWARTVWSYVKEAGIPANHPAHAAANGLLQVHSHAIEALNDAPADQEVSATAPIQELKSESMVSLNIGDRAYGKLVRQWHPKGYTFIKVIGRVAESGELQPVFNHPNIFLHRKGVEDPEVRYELDEGDSVAFTIMAGKNPGDFAAGDVVEAHIETVEDSQPDLFDESSESKSAAESEKPKSRRKVKRPAMTKEAAERSGNAVDSAEDSKPTVH